MSDDRHLRIRVIMECEFHPGPSKERLGRALGEAVLEFSKLKAFANTPIKDLGAHLQPLAPPLAAPEDSLTEADVKRLLGNGETN